MQIKECLSFDDTLLVPQFSNIRSRTNIKLKSGRFDIPIISSPMDTVTESEMAIAMADMGGLGVIHRYNNIDQQTTEVKVTKESGRVTAAAIGISGDYLERASELLKAGCDILCLDVAHGHHILMKEALVKLRHILGSSVELMAGNVASAKGYFDLSMWGADYIRCNIGSGSICSTRVQTGHGVPGLQTIFDCYEEKVKHGLTTKIISDGGIRNSGDIVKALAAGADYVMLGSLLSGTLESPGKIHTDPQTNLRYKVYRGMASKEAQKDWKGTYSSFEGVSSIVPFKGSVEDVVEDLLRGIRSGLSYSGALDLEQLRKNAEWIRQTHAGQIESSPHILRK
jgi:IMP dehydrogenase